MPDAAYTGPERRRSQSLLLAVVEKYVLPLAIAATVTIVGSAVSIWRAVDRLTDQVASHDRALVELRADMAAMKTVMVTQPQLLETLKRVEQQLEIVMLRSGAKLPPGSVTLVK